LIQKILNTFKEISKLPKISIKFKNSNSQSIDNYEVTYRYFTKPHRFKIIKNKSIGVAIIDFNLYQNFDEYYKIINGKNSSAYYARKASKRGYEFIEIDRRDYIDDIYEINTSSLTRQGKKMSNSYLKKVKEYQDKSNYRYFGVIDKNGKLLSYCNIGFYGEFTLISTLLGHKKYLNDGIMYLMLVEFTKLMFEEYQKDGYRYIMYDTFFGASDGLKKFKKKLGFKPYRVTWIWEN